MIASTQTNHPLHGGGEKISPKDRVSAACAALRAAGMRITQPRIAILGVLISHQQPICIEKIHDELKSNECDLVTVYRSLGAFEEIGLVRRSFLHNGTSLYQLSDRQDLSYNVVSKDTKEITPLSPEINERLAATIKQIEESLKADGFTEVSHLLEFFAKAPVAEPSRSARRNKAPVTT